MDSLPKTMFVLEIGKYNEAQEYYHSWVLLEGFVYKTFEGAAKRLYSWMEDMKNFDKSYEILKFSFEGTVYGTFVDYVYRGQKKRAKIFPVFQKD